MADGSRSSRGLSGHSAGLGQVVRVVEVALETGQEDAFGRFALLIVTVDGHWRAVRDGNPRAVEEVVRLQLGVRPRKVRQTSEQHTIDWRETLVLDCEIIL